MTLSDWRERTWGSRRWHRQRMWWRRRQSRSCESVTLKVTKTLKATTTSRDTTWRTEWRKERQFRVSFFAFSFKSDDKKRQDWRKSKFWRFDSDEIKKNFAFGQYLLFYLIIDNVFFIFFLFWWGLFIGLILTRFWIWSCRKTGYRKRQKKY